MKQVSFDPSPSSAEMPDEYRFKEAFRLIGHGGVVAHMVEGDSWGVQCGDGTMILSASFPAGNAAPIWIFPVPFKPKTVPRVLVEVQGVAANPTTHTVLSCNSEQAQWKLWSSANGSAAWLADNTLVCYAVAIGRYK